MYVDQSRCMKCILPLLHCTVYTIQHYRFSLEKKLWSSLCVVFVFVPFLLVFAAHPCKFTLHNRDFFSPKGTNKTWINMQPDDKLLSSHAHTHTHTLFAFTSFGHTTLTECVLYSLFLFLFSPYMEHTWRIGSISILRGYSQSWPLKR